MSNEGKNDSKEDCGCKDKDKLPILEGEAPVIAVNEKYNLGKNLNFDLGVLLTKDILGAESYLDEMGLSANINEAVVQKGFSTNPEMEEQLLDAGKGKIEKLEDLGMVIVPLYVNGKNKTFGGQYYFIFNGEPSEKTFVNRFIMDLRPPRTEESIRIIVSDLTEIGCPAFYPLGMGLFAAAPTINCNTLCSGMPSPYLVCVCDCICRNAVSFGGPFIGLGMTCIGSIAALGPSAGFSAILLIPSCASFMALGGIVVSICVLGCV